MVALQLFQLGFTGRGQFLQEDVLLPLNGVSVLQLVELLALLLNLRVPPIQRVQARECHLVFEALGVGLEAKVGLLTQCVHVLVHVDAVVQRLLLREARLQSRDLLVLARVLL